MNCPYCKYEFNYSQAVKNKDKKYCPKCNNHVVYTLEIYPNEVKSWGKPTKIDEFGRVIK